MLRTNRPGLGLVFALTASLCAAQNTGPGATSDTTVAVERRAADWAALAAAMEVKLSKLLPCDRRVRTTIEEVSKASDARIDLLAAHWWELAGRTAAQITAAKSLLTFEEAAGTNSRNERQDMAQERTRVAAQLRDLADSARRSADLRPALETLTRQDSTSQSMERASADRDDLREEIIRDLRDWIIAADSRREALEKQADATLQEGQKWRAYYAARLVRAQTECAIINPRAAAQDAAPKEPAASNTNTQDSGNRQKERRKE